MSGPCLTDAASETAPGGLSLGEKPLCGGPNVTQRSLRQSASVVSSPPLCRTCHDVRSSASWPTKSVSRRQESVSTYTRHAVPLCTVLAAGAPRTAVNSVMLQLRSREG